MEMHKKKTQSRITLYEPLHVLAEQVDMKRSPSLPLLVKARMKECSSKQDVFLETEEWLRRRRGQLVIERNGRVNDYEPNTLLQNGNGQSLKKREVKKDIGMHNQLDLIRIKSFEQDLRKKLKDKYSRHRDLTHFSKSHRDLTHISQSVQTLMTGAAPVYRARDRGPRPVRPHSVDMGGLAREKGRWLGVVPCHRVRVRECDEPYEEFRRAGIGVCFKGMFIQCTSARLK